MAAAAREMGTNVLAEASLSADGSAGVEQLTALVVRAEGAFAALCPELDIAADGDTPSEALAELASLVRASRGVASRKSISPGSPAPDEAVREFLLGHLGPGPIYSYQLAL